MKHYDISGDRTTILLVFDEGDELKQQLEAYLERERVDQASFTAIGALSSVELVAFDVEAKEYRTAVALEEQCELANLTGNATWHDGRPAVHAHVTIGKADGTAWAGHLKRATVRPTCEMIVRIYPVAAQKSLDSRWGLALYAL